MTYIIEHNDLGYFGGGAGCSCNSCRSASGNLSQAPAAAAWATIAEKTYSEGKYFYSLGKLSVSANTPINYYHPDTPYPPSQKFIPCPYREFSISASYPVSALGLQLPAATFYFQLSFNYNGNDLQAVAIRLLEGKSSRMLSSEFSIAFTGAPNILPLDPVAELQFQITGRWDPVGPDVNLSPGVDSIKAPSNLTVRADGSVRLFVVSEKGWVRNGPIVNCPMLAPRKTTVSKKH